MTSLPHLFVNQSKREFLLQFRDIRSSINSALFFLMIIVFFPLTIPANSNILRIATPGIIWMAMLLALFLSAERFFKQDYDDGVIEQWLVSGFPVSIIVFAKIVVHWLMNVIPMLTISPLLFILLKLSFYETIVIIASVFLGSPTIVALCAMSAAFSVSLKQKSVVMALILLPLSIPILILGSSTISSAMQNQPVSGFLAILVSISCLSLSLLPFAIAGIIKITLAD
ncbi:MAG: heme exporter protein CcmB [Legionellaceae bacterium]|nr:heme exporter protein CcmB [Legionellaceae bacterium]